MDDGASQARVGADVGGTFTDVVLILSDGRLSVRKLLSTPPSYDDAVVRGVTGLAGDMSESVGEVVHGTTVATNAVLERRGARTALVTTMGFRDVLELRRLRIPRMYEPFWRKPESLVPRRLRFEVNERMGVDGNVLRPLCESDVRAVAAALRDREAESVAVCLLHSYLFPDHERRVGAILREELPDVAICLSHEVMREQREYERSATTAVNAYVQPLMDRYLGAIGGRLREARLNAPLRIMQSSGGVMTAEDAARRPVLALESGPAAGVVAAQALSQRLGYDNVIAFDMGGTTAKASLIEEGAVTRGREYEVGGSLSAGSRLIRGAGELLRIPTIDIAEVGAGGGSVAWLDPAGGLQVGPRSAGASPGPACYGRGGIEPTVTDANVAMGFIPTGPLADGEIIVSRQLALGALDRLATRCGLSTAELADGIHAIANARMTRALRSVSSERGRDPRDFALLAYGGVGPVHAVGLAEELGCLTVLVPPFAGLFSALGLLFARPEFHDVQTCQLEARSASVDQLEVIYEQMRGRHDGVEFVRSAELRYGGQTWEIEVEVSDPVDLRALIAAFEDQHHRLYGVRDDRGAPVEIRALRLATLGRRPPTERLSVGDSFRPRMAVRETPFGELPVRGRRSLGEGRHDGPLLIDEYDTTVVVGRGWTVRRDTATETLILERDR